VKTIKGKVRTVKPTLPSRKIDRMVKSPVGETDYARKRPKENIPLCRGTIPQKGVVKGLGREGRKESQETSPKSR
jgi:hypothetical protein